MTRKDASEQRRGVIARALWQVAVTDGLHAVSMRRVAQAAGVSTGQVQHYFASRDDLVVFAARQMVDLARERHPPTLPGPTATTDLAPTVAELLLDAVAHVLRDPAVKGVALWYAFLAEAVTNPQLAAVLQAAKRGQEQYVTDLLTTWKAPLRDPERSARDLIALADGLALQVHLGNLQLPEAMKDITTYIDRLAAH